MKDLINDFLKNEKLQSFTQLQSHLMQIYLVLKLKSKKVLEIGVGSGFVTSNLKRYCDITTVDKDKNLKPDIVIDISNSKALRMFEDNSFDLILLCEVLEHIPYNKLREIFMSLNRISKKYILISVPDQSNYLNLTLFKHGFENILFSFLISNIKRFTLIFNKIAKSFNDFHYKIIKSKRKFNFDGSHYWELGIDKYSEKTFKRELLRHFSLVVDGRIRENPWHHFFLLKRKNEET